MAGLSRVPAALVDILAAIDQRVRSELALPACGRGTHLAAGHDRPDAL